MRTADVVQDDDRGGPARTPLVLVPGTLCDRRVFAPLDEALSGRLVVHVPLPALRSVEAMARAVLALAPARFAVAGLSLGGIVAATMATLAPERVRGVALIGSNARPVPEDARDERLAEAAAAAPDIEGYASRTLVFRYAETKARDRSEIAATVVAMALSAGPAALLAQTEAAVWRRDVRPDLRHVAVPAIVIGGGDDRVCPPDAQQEIAAALPRAKLVMLDGVGHLAPLEDPHGVAEAIAEWLDDVDAAEAHRLLEEMA